MKKINQKGFETLTIIGLTLVIGLVAGVGWYVWSKRDTASSPETSSAVPKQNESTEEEKVPDGYVSYSNTELGLKFAYPKDWGEPIQLSKTNAILTLAFQNTKVPEGTYGINGDGGYKIVLYANNGKQDFITGGRGGALWDCVGYAKTAEGYSCRNISIVDGVTKENTSLGLKNTEVVKSVNSEVLLAGYNYFFDEVYGAFINMDKDYYGAFIVTHDKNTEYKQQLKVLASTVDVSK